MSTPYVMVPTRHRADLTDATIGLLVQAGVRVVVVCSDEDRAAYAKRWVPASAAFGGGLVSVRTLPPNKTANLSVVHQWCVDIDNRDGKLILMDDDLFFKVRSETSKQRSIATPKDVARMVQWLWDAVDDFTHAGISADKDLGFCDVQPFTAIGGPMRSVLAYNLRTIYKYGIRFDRVVSKNDYDVTLQLYRLGFPSAVNRLFGHEQIGGPDLSGGNTDYRTEDVHAKASAQLAALHPRFVTVVEKERKGWSFKRKDVRVAWSNALHKGLFS